MHQHLGCTCAHCKVTHANRKRPFIACLTCIIPTAFVRGFCQHSINRPRFVATQREKASAELWCRNQQCHQSRGSETEHTPVRKHSRNHSRLKGMRLFHMPLTHRYLQGLTDQSAQATPGGWADGIPPKCWKRSVGMSWFCTLTEIQTQATANSANNFHLGVYFVKNKQKNKIKKITR